MIKKRKRREDLVLYSSRTRRTIVRRNTIVRCLPLFMAKALYSNHRQNNNSNKNNKNKNGKGKRAEWREFFEFSLVQFLERNVLSDIIAYNECVMSFTRYSVIHCGIRDKRK